MQDGIGEGQTGDTHVDTPFVAESNSYSNADETKNNDSASGHKNSPFSFVKNLTTFVVFLIRIYV